MNARTAIAHLNYLRSRTACLLSATALFSTCASAMVTLFRIDPTASSLTLQGVTESGTWQEQAPGSLTTTCQGWLVVDLQGSSIQIDFGSGIVPDQTNSWQPGPGGSTTATPASYGATATKGSGITSVRITAALRNLLFGLAGPPLAVNAGSFDTSSLNFTIPADGNSALDFRANGLLVQGGTTTLEGLSASNSPGTGTFGFLLEVQNLTLPVDFTVTTQVLTPGDTTLHFTGTIVARRGPMLLNDQILWLPSPTNHQEVTLIWDSEFALQKATMLVPPDWNTFATNAPVVISTTEPAAFFRVHGP